MTPGILLAGPTAKPVGKSSSSVPILVIDDNAAKRLAVKAVLAPLGYSIVEASSGVEALRCVKQQDFAVILLDVRMPIMNGFETAALIRLRRESEMTPIIFVTAHEKDEVISSNRYAEGAVDFISAPVQPYELRAKVSVFANLFLKAAELADQARDVQASADQLRLLTETAPIGIFQTDADNNYFYVNPQWAEITGMPAEAAVGKPWDIIIDAQQRTVLAAEFPAGMADVTEFNRRFEIPMPAATPRIVHLTSRSMRAADGTITGWVGTLSDVTHEAHSEAAMMAARDTATAASRLKSDFLANMSHEIRTPMNGVIGMTELLLETQLDATPARLRARPCASRARRCSPIINDILDFSKIEAGKLALEDIEFSVRDVLDDVVEPARWVRPRARGSSLWPSVDPAVPAVCSGDPGRLRQVLMNLSATPSSSPRAGAVTVRGRRCESAGRERRALRGQRHRRRHHRRTAAA